MQRLGVLQTALHNETPCDGWSTVSILRPIQRLVLASALVAMCAWQAPAAADMLPLVVDQTEGGRTAYWWSSSTPTYQGNVAGQLFGADVRGIVRPDRVPNFAVSRIFQRPDISVANARQLAAMSGADSFFLGVATSETHTIAWINSVAAEVKIRGGLYDTRSGALLREVELVGRGVSSSPAGAVQLASKSASVDLGNFQATAATRADESQQLEVFLRVSDGAEAYVNVRDALAKALQSRADIGECRASEGEVVLCVHPMPGQSAEHVQAALLTTLRAPMANVIVDDVQEEGSRLKVRARSQRPSMFGDATTLPR